IADFLPHLASLAHLFVGPHRRAHGIWTKRKPSVLPYDEFRGAVEAEGGTAALAFSASAQPDAFWLRVYGERMQATATCSRPGSPSRGCARGPNRSALSSMDWKRGRPSGARPLAH